MSVGAVLLCCFTYGDSFSRLFRSQEFEGLICWSARAGVQLQHLSKQTSGY